MRPVPSRAGHSVATGETLPEEGLVECRSSPGRDARSEARTQGVSIALAIGATEDAASERAAWPDGTDCISPSPPGPFFNASAGPLASLEAGYAEVFRQFAARFR